MTDKQFLKACQKATKAALETIRLIQIAEEEYERRFGVNPSDIYNDSWTDAIHYGHGNYNSIEEIERDHNLYCK